MRLGTTLNLNLQITCIVSDARRRLEASSPYKEVIFGRTGSGVELSALHPLWQLIRQDMKKKSEILSSSYEQYVQKCWDSSNKTKKWSVKYLGFFQHLFINYFSIGLEIVYYFQAMWKYNKKQIITFNLFALFPMQLCAKVNFHALAAVYKKILILKWFFLISFYNNTCKKIFWKLNFFLQTILRQLYNLNRKCWILTKAGFCWKNFTSMGEFWGRVLPVPSWPSVLRPNV